MTGFEHVGTVIPNPEGNNGDNNHHSLVEYEGQWYVFYHNRVLANREGYSNFQRSITLDEMTWDDAGNMNEVPAIRGDVRQLRSVDAFARIEAELLAGQGGIETDFAVEGGTRVGVAVTDIREGDWIAVSQVDFADGADTIHLRVASVGGGMVDVLQGGCEGFRDDPGALIGSCEVEPLEEEQSWADVSCAVEAAAGVHDLCLRFSGAGEQIMDLDYYYFE
jgi:arabinoxylan arabinofuranohydrolase